MLTRKIRRRIRWEKPTQGWLKLNTDGYSSGNPGLAGCGGVIWDDCRLLISRILQICIKDCFREAANRYEDSLVRMSFCLDADFSPVDRTWLMFLSTTSMERVLTGFVLK